MYSKSSETKRKDSSCSWGVCCFAIVGALLHTKLARPNGFIHLSLVRASMGTCILYIVQGPSQNTSWAYNKSHHPTNFVKVKSTTQLQISFGVVTRCYSTPDSLKKGSNGESCPQLHGRVYVVQALLTGLLTTAENQQRWLDPN